MVPARLLVSFASSVLSEHIPSFQDALLRYTDFRSSATFPNGNSNNISSLGGADASNLHSTDRHVHTYAKRDDDNRTQVIVFSALIPVLVLLSGVFSGLTLGYMSLDETQLNVLSVSGTPKQKEYANKIRPIRKNGHMLLVTLLIANMLVNETLPVICDPILGGGFQGVAVSTVLIIIFSEIIPMSLCSRHGLYIGAKMAGIARFLMIFLGVFSWPVAKLLEFFLGKHHGIVYRRAELKELIAMHSSVQHHGGDLRSDTVTIIGATLDLQDKTVLHAMTPIKDVFMLHIDAKLDYDTLRRICATGHSRVPVYEEVEVSLPRSVAEAYKKEHGREESDMKRSNSIKDNASLKKGNDDGTVKTKVKKIIGILLVKQCVLLDPEDAVPVRKMRLNKVHFVPQNEPLLGILDRFQEGRSHMAIVSRLSVEQAQSVKKIVKKSLTQRLKGAVIGDSSSSSSSSSSDSSDSDSDVDEKKEGKAKRTRFAKRVTRRKFLRKNSKDVGDLERGDVDAEKNRDSADLVGGGVRNAKNEGHKTRMGSFLQNNALEQSVPADAVMTKESVDEYFQTQGFDPAIMPLGIITLEDILEELIGEEIYDEFDAEGSGVSQTFVPPGVPASPEDAFQQQIHKGHSLPELGLSRSLSQHLHAPALSITNLSASTSITLASSPPSDMGNKADEPDPVAAMGIGKSSMSNALSRGLGFLRSRSAPPTPKDANTPRVVPPGVSAGTVEIPVLELDEDNWSHGTVRNGNRDSQLDDKFYEENDTASVVDNNMVVAPIPQSIVPLTTVSVNSRAPLRTASPGPSPALEAILLDRKRRGLLSSSSPSSSTSPNSSLPHAHGHSVAIQGNVPVVPPSVVITPPSVGDGGGSGSGNIIGGAGGVGQTSIRSGKKGGFKSSPLSANGT